MKRSLAWATLLCALTGTVLAAEGMWQPSQLPGMADELKTMGLEIKPAELSRLTEHPMNAVIDLAGCSASFVSPKGLVITNHHCSWGTLQYNSTEEKNLLDDGFLAANLGGELPAAPGSRVRVTVAVREVTGAITKGLDASAQRRRAIPAHRGPREAVDQGVREGRRPPLPGPELLRRPAVLPGQATRDPRCTAGLRAAGIDRRLRR